MKRRMCRTCGGSGVDESRPGNLVACPDCCGPVDGPDRLVSINIRAIRERLRRGFRRLCLDEGITMEEGLVKLIEKAVTQRELV